MLSNSLQSLTPNVKQISLPGTTTLVQTNLLTTNIVSNKLIKWEEINFPQSWILPQETNAEPILNQNIDQIVQTTEGDVEIQFNSLRLPKIPRSLSMRSQSSRYSSALPNMPSRASTSQNREEIETVDNIRISQNQVPQAIYQKEHISGLSPTASEMGY